MVECRDRCHGFDLLWQLQGKRDEDEGVKKSGGSCLLPAACDEQVFDRVGFDGDGAVRARKGLRADRAPVSVVRLLTHERRRSELTPGRRDSVFKSYGILDELLSTGSGSCSTPGDRYGSF